MGQAFSFLTEGINDYFWFEGLTGSEQWEAWIKVVLNRVQKHVLKLAENATIFGRTSNAFSLCPTGAVTSNTSMQT